MNAGIVSIGTALPKQVRRNSDWPSSFLERFEERKKRDITTLEFGGQGEVPDWLAVVSKYEADPFRGSVERRVLEDGRMPSDLEVEAGAAALENGGIRPEEIDVLIVGSQLPDLLGTGNATNVHRRLGLRSDAIVMNLDDACASLLVSMLVGQAQIQSGQARKVLIIESVVFSRMLDYDLPYSVNFGDGASAVVMAEVGPGRGILGHAWGSDGTLNKAVCYMPRDGGDWYGGKSRIILGSMDVEGARRMVPLFGPWAKDTVGRALAHSKVDPSEVGFWACHQPTAWFNQLSREAAGFEGVAYSDTFPKVAGLAASNVAFNLDDGVRGGKLGADDVAVLYAMGSGATWGSIVMRWGR